MICPNCGSDHVITATESTTRTTDGGFDCCLSCLGYLIFNIPGLLCGLCGSGPTTETRTKVVNVCQNCGHRF